MGRLWYRYWRDIDIFQAVSIVTRGIVGQIPRYPIVERYYVSSKSSRSELKLILFYAIYSFQHISGLWIGFLADCNDQSDCTTITKLSEQPTTEKMPVLESRTRTPRSLPVCLKRNARKPWKCCKRHAGSGHSQSKVEQIGRP